MTNKQQLNLADEYIDIDMVYTARAKGLYDGAKNITECQNRLLTEHKYLEDMKKALSDYDANHAVHFHADQDYVNIRVEVSTDDQVEELENIGFEQEDQDESDDD